MLELSGKSELKSAGATQLASILQQVASPSLLTALDIRFTVAFALLLLVFSESV